MTRPIALPARFAKNTAISIRQPFVELILLGVKEYEYRSRPCFKRGTVLLYATKKAQADCWHDAIPDDAELPLGMIVGHVDIVDCEDLANGTYGYHLANPVRLSAPYPPVGYVQPCFWINAAR